MLGAPILNLIKTSLKCFVCHRGEVLFQGNRDLKHPIYGKSGTIADVLMPVLAVAINKPLFKRLDECFWILHSLIFPNKSEAKFVQDLTHL